MIVSLLRHNYVILAYYYVSYPYGAYAVISPRDQGLELGNPCVGHCFFSIFNISMKPMAKPLS